MLVIENNREIHPILNQIYVILSELQNQGIQLALCKVPTHIGIIGNEEADWAAKEVIDHNNTTFIQTTTSPSGELETPNGKGNVKTALVSYTILNHAYNSCWQY